MKKEVEKGERAEQEKHAFKVLRRVNSQSRKETRTQKRLEEKDAKFGPKDMHFDQ